MTEKTRLQSMVHAFDLTKATAKFEDELIRKYIISLLTLTLGQGQTRNVVMYPLHHMVYALAKFEAAMSDDLGGNALTRTFLI